MLGNMRKRTSDSGREPVRPGGDESRRERILRAAIDEFAEKGLAGARVDQIARRSRSNKQLIYYYFESKVGLYRAALGALLEDFEQRVAEREHLPPEPWLDQVLRMHREVSDEPFWEFWRRFFMWEALENAGTVIQREEERRLNYRVVIGWLEDAQRRGEIDASFDAEILTLMLQSMLILPYMLPQVTKLITGDMPSTDRFQERHRRILVQLTQLIDPGTERAHAKPKRARPPRARKITDPGSVREP
jgi:TetR/AcrR family transcriptional regulator